MSCSDPFISPSRIFSGTAVMANYVIMITWLPAAVSIAERITCVSLGKPVETMLARLAAPFRAISQLGRKVEDVIISLVISVPLLWIALLGKCRGFRGNFCSYNRA